MFFIAKIENNDENLSSTELFEKLEIVLIERAKTFVSSASVGSNDNDNNNTQRIGSQSSAKKQSLVTNKNKKSTIQNRFILGQFYFEHVTNITNYITSQSSFLFIRYLIIREDMKKLMMFLIQSKNNLIQHCFNWVSFYMMIY